MARPRSNEARRKALDAAGDLIAERGVTSLTIEDVATRSGVAKTTIYRHWPDRTSLIIDTINKLFEYVRTPDTGTLRGDLDAYFAGMMRTDLSGNVAQIMPCIIAEAARDPEFAAVLERIGAERERVVKTIVDRALERGEIRPDFAELDSDTLIGVLIGPIVFHKLIRRRVLTPGYVKACLDVALSGLGIGAPVEA